MSFDDNTNPDLPSLLKGRFGGLGEFSVLIRSAFATAAVKGWREITLSDSSFEDDGEGRMVDFKNCVIILTSNVASQLIMSMTHDPELMLQPEDIGKALREPLLKVFPTALLGRIGTVPYFPLSDEMLGSIICLQPGRIKKRITENHKRRSATAKKWCPPSRCAALKSKAVVA